MGDPGQNLAENVKPTGSLDLDAEADHFVVSPLELLVEPDETIM